MPEDKKTKKTMPKWVKTLIFTAAGALIGFLYYVYRGCSTGNCMITSNMYSTMAYFGLIGAWISFIAGGGCCCGGGSCRTHMDE